MIDKRRAPDFPGGWFRCLLALPLMFGWALQERTIRVSASLVLVPVSVTDQAGKAVTGLSLGDFEIRENGETVALARMSDPGQAPLTLAMLFDVSGSVRARFELERQAAAGFLKSVLRETDQAALISLGREPKVLQPWTTSPEQALAGLAAVEPTSQATAFYDCLAATARMLKEAGRPGDRRVLVVLSDGEDNLSYDNRFEDALREVQESDCLFYSINPSGASVKINKVSRRGQEAMDAIARQTGGASFVADRVEDLGIFYERVAAVLKDQYVLEYYSPDSRPDGGYRRIDVHIPSRPELIIRARQGYYAEFR